MHYTTQFVKIACLDFVSDTGKNWLLTYLSAQLEMEPYCDAILSHIVLMYFTLTTGMLL